MFSVISRSIYHMGKERKSKREDKKAPLLSMKEKRAEKKNKKKEAGSLSVLTERKK